MTRRYVLDSSYRRPVDGTTIVAGSPLRLFRLGPRGVAVARELERTGTAPAHGAPLVSRLLDAGAVHPAAPGSPVAAEDLTVVVPARDELPRASFEGVRTIVVDDASDVPLTCPGAEVIRLDVNRGPAAARNAGMARVDTRVVAFVDTDVDVDTEALRTLAAHLDDERVGLVAPRIVGSGDSVLERYEEVRSPLDLGTEPARIAAGTRVSYVPGAVLVCRADAVRAVGGFDEGLRWGEDVDLVWRLVDAGWRCRYEPAVVARHRTRDSLRAWLLQRVRYGSSAAPLAQRHPGALAPVRMNGWSAATWAAIALRRTRLGVALGLGTTVALVRMLRDLPARETLRLAGLGHLYSGRLLLATMLRAWWPVAVVAATLSPRLRRVLVVAAVALPLVEMGSSRPRLSPATYVALRALDDLAYGAGVWLGAIEHHTLDPLTPSINPWPPR